ncbi:hypothetical protein BX600DRAFT_555817 [Xylariales sp. PMI_506]|nr:hypothetical protein BX600DRAFT_555817 [Xylariales sp. PMI_506]
MSKIHLRLAQEFDAPAIGFLQVTGFGDSPLSKAMYPERLRVKPGHGDQIEWMSGRVASSLNTPGSFYVVAVETGAEEDGTPEKLVGFAQWLAPREPQQAAATPDAAAEEAAKEERRKRIAALPVFMDGDVLTKSQEQVDKLLKDAAPIFGGNHYRDMWSLNAITVLPSHRRRGIGAHLLRWGVDQATAKGEAIWLIAAPDGRPLYLSFGFTDVSEAVRCGEVIYLMYKAGTEAEESRQD